MLVPFKKLTPGLRALWTRNRRRMRPDRPCYDGPLCSHRVAHCQVA